MAAIAQISADEAEHEEGEQDLVEISEYVRVVAMSIFLECNRDAPGKGSAARLH